jgi:micrococcal nuclease
VKTRGKIGIFLAVVGILASLVFIGTNQVNQETEKTPISVSPKIQDEPTKETVKVETKPEPKPEVKIEPKTEPVQPEPVETEPVQSEPVDPEPINTEPVETEPVQPEPIFECSGSAKCIIGTVDEIFDGDTLRIDGTIIRISLTDTPERTHEEYAKATEFTTSLCPVGSLAIVDQDDLQLKDRFGRTLGKVICSGKVLNSELLDYNLAKISKEFCSKSEFASESWAQENGCADANNVSTDGYNENVMPIPQIPELSGNEGGCDLSYPDFCIATPPPDLDCKHVAPNKNFTVLPPDPHRFDGDKDGIGCE